MENKITTNQSYWYHSSILFFYFVSLSWLSVFSQLSDNTVVFLTSHLKKFIYKTLFILLHPQPTTQSFLSCIESTHHYTTPDSCYMLSYKPESCKQYEMSLLSELNRLAGQMHQGAGRFTYRGLNARLSFWCRVLTPCRLTLPESPSEQTSFQINTHRS